MGGLFDRPRGLPTAQLGRGDNILTISYLLYNAAIRRAGLEGTRHTNPVVDGQLVPRERKRTKKRRRDEPAAAPSPRARRR